MRRIEQTKAFRRDYKRESKSQNRTALERDFTSIVRALALDQRLQLVRLGSHSELGL